MNKGSNRLSNTMLELLLTFRQQFSMIAALCILLISCSLFGDANADRATLWVGTWSTAPQLVEPGNMPPEPGLSNNTLRQVVRVSLGGDSLRVRFTNEFSTSPVTLQAVQIAVSKGGSAIDASTSK